MKFRTFLLGVSALFVALNAAFFSVSGLSKLFAGAAFSVIIMASSLELAKLITAGYLYNYWDKINKSFRIYLSGAVLILILITSLGIYGFLTSAFQSTYNQFSVSEKQLSFLQQKEKFWADDVARYDVELSRISENISTLSNARATGIQVRDTASTTGFRNTISTTELRLSQKRIGVEEQNRKDVQAKREVVADSLQTIQLKILDVESDEGVSSELGPLQYLSGLLDKPMDVIINWFILIIIFVFDPLAVALVIAFSNAVKVDKGETDKKKVIAKRELYGEKPNDDSDDSYEDNQFETDLDDINDWDDTLQDGLDGDDDGGWSDEDFLSEDELNEYFANKANDREEFLEDISNYDLDDEWEPVKDEETPTEIPFTDEELSNLATFTKKDVETIIEANENPPPPTEELVEVVNSYKEFVNPLSNLKKDISRRGIDIDDDGTIDGYDNTGDGLIDEPTPTSSKRAQYVMQEKPFYARANFNWGDRSNWINNQNAVNYWLTYVKNESDNSYPTDFTSKTY